MVELTIRSLRPSRKIESSSPPLSGTKRSTVRGACSCMARSNCAPYRAINRSLVRMLKVRSKVANSTSSRLRNTSPACSTSARTCSCKASARGVGTRPRPARTRIGSPMASRIRPSVRLMAAGLRFMRRAAPTTLPSSSRASRATNRFISGICIARHPRGSERTMLPAWQRRPCCAGHNYTVHGRPFICAERWPTMSGSTLSSWSPACSAPS
ncbi:hypothetical protein D3C81_1348560 [compost metagenome]